MVGDDLLKYTELVEHVLHIMWRDDTDDRVIHPDVFVQNIWSMGAELFPGNEQQDAQEFVLFLLETLQEEVSRREFFRRFREPGNDST